MYRARTLVLLLAAGCGSASEQQGPTTVTPPPVAASSPPAAPAAAAPAAPLPVEVRLRVIHATAAASRLPIEVTYATGADAPGSLGGPVVYGASSQSYTAATLPPGSTGMGLNASVEGFDPVSYAASISAGQPHSAFVIQNAERPTELSIMLAHDSDQAPAVGRMGVRFVHAVVGWGNVDVCAAGENARAAGTPILPGARYGRVTGAPNTFDGYVEQPASSTPISLQVREASTETPCSGRVLGAVDVSAPQGSTFDAENVTLVAVGRATGRPAVARTILVCLDAPAALTPCSSLPMRNH
jgi:hypothetical protein